MKTDDIRRSFLEFFAARGHTVVPSTSLIPGSDPTLLFVNSGMVPFKDCFLGAEKRGYVRATSCQKSLRISGKHNDLENVGRTARHHTFFEMLGNFSFGDYFKDEAIRFAWEYLTEVVNLPKERLWVTIYEQDGDAGDLWRRNTDITPSRILEFGEEDNFWSMGETGPCGPSSEIFYYLGDDVNTQSEEDFRTSEGRYVEIWNLVFMQFNRDTQGVLHPLPIPSVDTGMGLERFASATQGVRSNYDTDLLRAIIAYVEQLSGRRYEGTDYTPREGDPQYDADVAHRVIADHVRASAALIADGIHPSSEGRGYVLRRLIRRACRHARVLGFTEPFLYQVAGRFVELYEAIYPEFRTAAKKIAQIIRAEEEKFLVTLDSGLVVLQKEIRIAKEAGRRQLSGDVAFLLHDTYGFPLDMTEDLLKAEQITVDHEDIERAMSQQRERSRSNRASAIGLVLQRAVKPTSTKFVGYTDLSYETKVFGIYNSEGPISQGKAGEEIAIVTRETPFYAESGGQLGDTGTISSNTASLEVIDTQKAAGDTIVHICRVMEGELAPESDVRLEVDQIRRARLCANHSATHLLHAALREVLGDHVKQAGSRVSDDTLRFDYSHFDTLSLPEIDAVQSMVEDQITANASVVIETMSLEQAKKSGATALFSEKYGENVRVVQIGPRSRELCGGTHVTRSGDIGAFVMLTDGGVSSGIRRAEAAAGVPAFLEWKRHRRLLQELTQVMKAPDHDLVERARKLVERVRTLERELERATQSKQSAEGGRLGEQAQTAPSGVKYVASFVRDSNPKQLREMADELKQRLSSGVIVLGTIVDGKGVLLTAVTDDLVSQIHAGKLLDNLTAISGGRGGGRPDLAQAGGGDPDKIQTALEHVPQIL